MTQVKDVQDHQPNEVPQPEKLTAPDMELKRYIELTEKIKELSAERDQIKRHIKHQGSYSTSHYVATVETVDIILAPSKDVLLKEFGPSVKRLFKHSTRTTVKVMPKGGE